MHVKNMFKLAHHKRRNYALYIYAREPFSPSAFPATLPLDARRYSYSCHPVSGFFRRLGDGLSGALGVPRFRAQKVLLGVKHHSVSFRGVQGIYFMRGANGVARARESITFKRGCAPYIDAWGYFGHCGGVLKHSGQNSRPAS